MISSAARISRAAKDVGSICVRKGRAQAFATRRNKFTQVSARRGDLNLRSSTALGSLVSRRWATVLLSVCAFQVYCTNNSKADAESCMDLTTSSSGLQYCDIVVGEGAAPVKGGKIQAHYIGKLTNGKKFDASYDRGQPLAFQVGVGQVIKGWDMGIVGTDVS